MSLLQVENISKSYGNFWAVNQVSFSLEAGQMLALIGPNGAGKSTTFNMIGGQTRADNGCIWFDANSLSTSKREGALTGKVDLLGLSSEEIWSLGIGRTFQIAEIFPSLTVRENVQLALQVAHGKGLVWWNKSYQDYQDEAESLLIDLAMQENINRAASEIAYGDVKRLELAMALASQPKLLLMDEPTAGMSPTERMEMMALTKRLSQQRDMAVLFTEHSMDVVFTYADYIIVMAAGNIVAAGTPNQIKDNPVVKEVYLGSVVVEDKAIVQA
ncbi:ABC transporter ATP-binding protein [Pelistega europaea]|uniref:ABC transporter ATP-binding protein n=1 Tax=Pelistega europaea TaxID=106147 RepID=A0A7Y4L7V3_9BURK|nr:ABC transporter ATP-binding protein [Pelistega europaea]NOL48558.1 ABC transporter ATP-binding protein [Pelistega europaea]